MAIRTIRTDGDPVLRKISKPVKEITPKIVTLVDDMLDTMYEAMGVGLAAPQVGILKRIVVIDIGDGPIVLINPEILETSGEQTGEVELEGEGLLARAFCHEIDHLDGKMYTDLVEGDLHRTSYDEDEDFE